MNTNKELITLDELCETLSIGRNAAYRLLNQNGQYISLLKLLLHSPYISPIYTNDCGTYDTPISAKEIPS